MVTGVELRPLAEGDLDAVCGWLRRPHVARWWPPDLDLTAEREKFRRRIRGEDPTHMLVIEVAGRPVGWCQWYRWGDEPDAADYGATSADFGIDYAIGEPSAIGRGIGTRMVAVLIGQVRSRHPTAGFLVDVDPANRASQRVLEHNGFALVGVRAVRGATSGTAAMFRLSARSPSPGTPAPP